MVVFFCEQVEHFVNDFSNGVLGYLWTGITRLNSHSCRFWEVSKGDCAVLFLSMHLSLVVCCISCTKWKCCVFFFSLPLWQLTVEPHLSFLFHHWQSAYIFLFAGVALLHLVKQSKSKNCYMFSNFFKRGLGF